MHIADLEQIKGALPGLDLLPAIEAGFVAYSEGRANVPPVGELMMAKGEVHIKYGCIEDDPYYVIKVASGFFANADLGLPSGNGMMLLFSQDTGAPVAVLLDGADTNPTHVIPSSQRVLQSIILDFFLDILPSRHFLV